MAEKKKTDIVNEILHDKVFLTTIGLTSGVVIFYVGYNLGAVHGMKQGLAIGTMSAKSQILDGLLHLA